MTFRIRVRSWGQAEGNGGISPRQHRNAPPASAARPARNLPKPYIWHCSCFRATLRAAPPHRKARSFPILSEADIRDMFPQAAIHWYQTYRYPINKRTKKLYVIQH